MVNPCQSASLISRLAATRAGAISPGSQCGFGVGLVAAILAGAVDRTSIEIEVMRLIGS